VKTRIGRSVGCFRRAVVLKCQSGAPALSAHGTQGGGFMAHGRVRTYLLGLCGGNRCRGERSRSATSRGRAVRSCRGANLSVASQLAADKVEVGEVIAREQESKRWASPP
jgi:hypothetical protein